MTDRPMVVTYDAEADALALDLLPGGVRARTQELAPGILTHWDREGRLIELELLGASARYPVQTLARFPTPAQELTLAAAAREAGLRPTHLRNQVLRGKLPATKRGRDWLVTRAALWTYLENREAQGRPAASRKGRRVRRQTAAKPA